MSILKQIYLLMNKLKLYVFVGCKFIKKIKNSIMLFLIGNSPIRYEGFKGRNILIRIKYSID
jgi:hypothetical protein